MTNQSTQLHCLNCGHEISEGAKQCPICGINLEATLDKTEQEALAQPYLDKAEKDWKDGRNLKRALADCEKALEYVPESAEAHNLRGLILDDLGNAKDAILEFQEAARLKPDFTNAATNLKNTEADYSRLVRRGRNLFFLAATLILAKDVIQRLFFITTMIITQKISGYICSIFFVMGLIDIALLYLVYRGYSWARILLCFWYTVSILYTIRIPSQPSIWDLISCSVLIMCFSAVALLLIPNSVRAFQKAQRSKGGKGVSQRRIARYAFK